MLKLKSFNLVLLFLFILFSVSCEKSGILSPQDISSMKLLKKIIENSNTNVSFTYSGEMLTRIETIKNNNVIRWISFNYDTDGFLKSEESYNKYLLQESYYLFEYKYNSKEHVDNVEISSKNTIMTVIMIYVQ